MAEPSVDRAPITHDRPIGPAPMIRADDARCTSGKSRQRRPFASGSVNVRAGAPGHSRSNVQSVRAGEDAGDDGILGNPFREHPFKRELE